MRHTTQQTSAKTLADLYRALDHQHAVTITYRKTDGTETARTIEAYDIRTTTAGHIVIKAMDRDTQESRTFRLDQIAAYTLHRSTYVVERPDQGSTHETETPELATVEDVFWWELARDDTDLFTEYRTTLAA